MTSPPTVPVVTAHEVAEDRARFTLTLPPDLLYFQGHFKGLPILPGVAQLHFAIDCAMSHLHIPGRFSGMRALKFKRPLQPGQSVELILEWRAARRQLQFTYQLGDETVSSGTILFAA